MKRSEFAKLSRMYCSTFKAKILQLPKEKIMGSCMEVVMAEEISAVADLFEAGTERWSLAAYERSKLDKLVRRLKPGQYTYDVFTLCIPDLCEPSDDGNYGIFDHGAKYDELASAIERAMDWTDNFEEDQR